MNVLLLGATGRTGRLILSELLAKGNAVNVIVRDRHKVQIASPNLVIFEGSTLDESLMAAAIDGCTAVISALNISRNSDFPWSALRTPKFLMSDTIKLVIAAAAFNDLKRVLVLSAWGASETIMEIPWWFRWMIRSSNIKYGYLDHERQENLLMESGLDWTSIRPVVLVNSKADKPIKITLNGEPKPSLMISRHAVARFVIEALKQDQYIGMKPVISWK